jgi:hypothetical protein
MFCFAASPPKVGQRFQPVSKKFGGGASYTRPHFQMLFTGEFGIRLRLDSTSEVETADDADDAHKQELGDETGRMSPKHAPQTKPVYHP